MSLLTISTWNGLFDGCFALHLVVSSSSHLPHIFIFTSNLERNIFCPPYRTIDWARSDSSIDCRLSSRFTGVEIRPQIGGLAIPTIWKPNSIVNSRVNSRPLLELVDCCKKK